MTRYWLIAAYLGAIVAANLTLAQWGENHPEVALYNAFLFIGLDLVSRDLLHDFWRGHLIRNMSVLIVAGSVISYILGRWWGSGVDVAQIALASAIAFGAASSADAIAYHFLRSFPWYERVNGSNIVGAAVDSLVFIALWPFGFDFTLVFTLWAAKVAGGVVWSLALLHMRSPDDDSRSR